MRVICGGWVWVGPRRLIVLVVIIHDFDPKGNRSYGGGIMVVVTTMMVVVVVVVKL